ncbi:unnamed protein product [Ceratitis capitata]|uniref:(Mediterranean fruit fly) hypothetical protein n=1 Tax=Ceratitis capitata TaxID=7213 RepID=A0A811UNB6_CERCA|nr:unnamed protein product [Ceratitis capitata]
MIAYCPKATGTMQWNNNYNDNNCTTAIIPTVIMRSNEQRSRKVQAQLTVKNEERIIKSRQQIANSQQPAASSQQPTVARQHQPSPKANWTTPSVAHAHAPQQCCTNQLLLPLPLPLSLPLPQQLESLFPSRRNYHPLLATIHGCTLARCVFEISLSNKPAAASAAVIVVIVVATTEL